MPPRTLDRTRAALADFLRQRRECISPAQAGLPSAGRRRTPGRPVTYGTADKFLEHFGLSNLYDLPGVQEMKAAGLLDLSIPVGFEVPDPTRAPDVEDSPLLPGEEESPEFAQDFVGED